MYAVIMAGGRGTRFWPLSRERRPKQLIDFTGRKTLIQETVDRIAPLVPLHNVLIVTGEAHAGEVAKQFPDLPKENILVEPVGRNTAPCIGLAAFFIKKKVPDSVMIVLPADHVIADNTAFIETLQAAAAAAEKGNYLVTIGIKPAAPETGYGYIEGGKPLSLVGDRSVLAVASFREKPDLKTARSFLERGTFYWNSGMFIWKVSSILEALQKELPDTYGELLSLEGALGTAGQEDAIRRAYERIRPVSIDYGIMEKADNVIMIPGAFGWNDLGSWDALMDVSQKDRAGNATRGRIVTVDTKDSLVLGTDKLVALVGVDNLIVIETEDALLILKRGHSQDVKKAVEILEQQGMKELL